MAALDRYVIRVGMGGRTECILAYAGGMVATRAIVAHMPQVSGVIYSFRIANDAHDAVTLKEHFMIA